MMRELRAAVRQHRLPFAIGALGLLASLALWLCSVGSNDIRTWEKFAVAIREYGIAELYQLTWQFNHPPWMGYLSWLCLMLANATGIPFAILFKAFPVAGNLGASLLLWAIWRTRGDARTAAWAFALSQWSLSSILVGSFHGNTDCLCAALCLAAGYLLEVRRRPFLGGLALAAAINVKIIPLLMVCPAMAGFRSRRDLMWFIGGSALSSVPFLIALAAAGTPFFKNLFAYQSSAELWGVHVLCFASNVLPGVSKVEVTRYSDFYFQNGKYLLITAILLLTAYGAFVRLTHTQLLAAACALFLILAPGFGVQYAGYLPPLAFAVSLRWGLAISTVMGLFIGLVYAHYMQSWFPLESVHSNIPTPSCFVGFAGWVLMLQFLPKCLRPAPWRNAGESVSGLPAEPPIRPTP
ncbi:MAG: DUF2029 domain-containing protein [Planctomycetes bacterium]|nr:DUF2029 domain-containing protein [Planctomycetota bacterium]